MRVLQGGTRYARRCFSNTNKKPIFLLGLMPTTSCLKKLPTIFLLCVVKYEPNSVKIGRHVPEWTLNKMYIKYPLHLKYVPTLPWEIVRLSRKRSTYIYILIFNKSLNSCKQDWQLLSQKLSNPYYFRSSLYHMLEMSASSCPVRTQARTDDGCTSPTERSITAWELLTRSWCVVSVCRHEILVRAGGGHF